MNRFIQTIVVLGTSLMLCTLALPADAAGRVKARGAVVNEQGGVTAGSAAAGSGPQGGRFARGAAVSTDGQGNAVGGSAAAGQTAAGGRAARAGQFERNADGSFNRQGGVAAQSAAGGRLQSTGQVSGDGNGNVSGVRNTSATGAEGNSYQGQTTATTGQGVQHSGTCYDANGNVISCPRR
jgi:hypothetical protein